MAMDDRQPEVRFWFVDAALWDGKDAFPYPVPVHRIPVVGEFVMLPDQLGWWEVVQVAHDYSHGLHYLPTVGVLCVKPSAKAAWLAAQGR